MIQLLKGDCLIESDKIESGSVDLILTDLPYGTVKDIKNVNHGMSGKCDWDVVIDTTEIMKIANRILRKNGKMILFAQQPFTNELINKQTPNIKFSYSMIWEKDHFANALTAKKAPLNYYEDVLVFSKSGSGEGNKVKDYLIQEKDKSYANEWTDIKLRDLCEVSLKGGGLLCHYWGVGQWMMPTEKRYIKLQETGFFKKPYSELKKENERLESTFNLWEGKKYKSNILKYKKDYNGYHPTQKPILLLEDLIKTFSNDGNTVVDLTMGSGSTGVACVNTKRKFIGIEQESKYFEIAKERIKWQ
jgi:DNA modification methylase